MRKEKDAWPFWFALDSELLLWISYLSRKCHFVAKCFQDLFKDVDQLRKECHWRGLVAFVVQKNYKNSWSSWVSRPSDRNISLVFIRISMYPFAFQRETPGKSRLRLGESDPSQTHAQSRPSILAIFLAPSLAQQTKTTMVADLSPIDLHDTYGS